MEPAITALASSGVAFDGRPDLSLGEINARLHERKVSIAGVDDDALRIFTVERSPRTVSGDSIERGLNPGANERIPGRFFQWTSPR
jgi:hypothetical protein